MRNCAGAGHDGFGEWADLSEALIRGVSHGLTNRISSIGSFVQLHGMGDTDFTVESFLPRESDQLQRLVRGLRMLVISTETHALELMPLLNDAMELYSHHTRMHSLRYAVEVHGEPLLPVRATPAGMLRLMVILLEMSAVEIQESAGTEVPIRVDASEQELVVRLQSSRVPSAYAVALAEDSGASLISGESGLALHIPTLGALRARAAQQ